MRIAVWALDLTQVSDDMTSAEVAARFGRERHHVHRFLKDHKVASHLSVRNSKVVRVFRAAALQKLGADLAVAYAKYPSLGG